MSPALVLASRSPQRRAILEQVGVHFESVVHDVAELEEGAPDAIAVENARRKAAAVGQERPGRLVLGVDTVVSAAGQVYGKPHDADEARRVLGRLSGIRHTVLSGLCLRGPEPERERTSVTETQVRFRELGERLLDWYVASGEWRERAGGYAIQGRGAALVAEIHGDYLNVVGLPLATLLELEPALIAPAGPAA